MGAAGVGPIISRRKLDLSPQVGFTQATISSRFALQPGGEPAQSGGLQGQWGPSESPFVPAVGFQANSLLRSSSQEFSIPWLISPSPASPLPGSKHFLFCFQLTLAWPSFKFLPPPSPSLTFYPKASTRTLSESWPDWLWEVRVEVPGYACCFPGLYMATFLPPGTTAYSVISKCPQELGLQYLCPFLFKRSYNGGYPGPRCFSLPMVLAPILKGKAIHSFIHSFT